MEHTTDTLSHCANDFENDVRPPENAGSTRRPVRAHMLVAIDTRTLERQCFVRCVELAYPELDVIGCSSIDEWRGLRAMPDVHQVILYNTGNHEVADPAVTMEIKALVTEAGKRPVVVLGASNDLREMIAAFDCGARGYLPSSVGIDDIVEATRLTSSGGIFLPMASIVALRDALSAKPEPKPAVEDQLTERQLAVCDALRRGKSNKIIAYELNLCESTVKVHIRNIMKKLRATNRTEAAFKLNATYFAQDDARG